MELKVKLYFRNTYVNIGELTLDGFYNEVFMDVLDKSNVDELVTLGLLTDKVDLTKYTPDTNHQNLIERGYSKDENPDFFKDYKNVDLVSLLKFYQGLRAVAIGQSDKLRKLGDDNLRRYYVEQFDKLINVFELCLKNGYKCHFTAYAA